MYLKNIITLFLAALLSTGLYAQSNTMYYQSGPPQAYWLNPATQPICNVFVGLPVVNNLYFESYNTGALISDLLWNDEYTSDVLHPFHPDANMNNILNNVLSQHFAAVFGYYVDELLEICYLMDIKPVLDIK